MAITIAEKLLSRETTLAEKSQVQLLYLLTGSDDDAALMGVLSATAPATYGGLDRQSLNLSQVGPHLWEGQAQYGVTESAQTGESSFSFEIGGGTQHVTQSKHTTPFAPEGESAGDLDGAIGFDGQKVQGVDLVVPVYQFAETHYLHNDLVTNTYKGLLFRLAGKTNSAAFKGCAAGECLFLGASGSKRGRGDWEITFKFAASPNVTGLTLGSITGIAKKGWEYLWVRYADAKDDEANTILKRPAAVYVEKVYDEGDFSTLGIGTT